MRSCYGSIAFAFAFAFGIVGCSDDPEPIEAANPEIPDGGRPDVGMPDAPGSDPDVGVMDAEPRDLGMDAGGDEDAGFAAWDGTPPEVECAERVIGYRGGLDGLDASLDVLNQGYTSFGPRALVDGREVVLFLRAFGPFPDGTHDGEMFFFRKDLPPRPMYCGRGTVGRAQDPVRVWGESEEIRSFPACEEAGPRVPGTIEMCASFDSGCPGGRTTHLSSSVFGLEHLFAADGNFLSGGRVTALTEAMAFSDEELGLNLIWVPNRVGRRELYCALRVEKRGDLVEFGEIHRYGTCSEGTLLPNSAVTACWQSRR